jgi:hypothetical protein
MYDILNCAEEFEFVQLTADNDDDTIGFRFRDGKFPFFLGIHACLEF